MSKVEEKIGTIPDSEEKRTIKGLLYLLDLNAYGLDFKVSAGHVTEIQILGANLTKIPRNLKQLGFIHTLFLGTNIISHLTGLDKLPALKLIFQTTG